MTKDTKYAVYGSRNLGPFQVRDLGEQSGEITDKTHATHSCCSSRASSSMSLAHRTSVGIHQSLSFQNAFTTCVSQTPEFCGWSKDMLVSMSSVINIPECIALKMSKIENCPI